MRHVQQLFRCTVGLGAIVIVTGCVSYTAIQQLPPAEQETLRAYSKVMPPTQVRTYLNKATPAERATYLDELGLTQRFQALDPQDREALLAGYIREGMSAEALRFLWGEPYHTSGRTGYYEYWYYLGSSVSLSEYGNEYSHLGTMVEVYLVDDRVDWWLETTPSDIEMGGDDTRIR